MILKFVALNWYLDRQQSMNEMEYNASKFEKEEISPEIENWMANQDLLETAEAYTANGPETYLWKRFINIINLFQR